MLTNRESCACGKIKRRFSCTWLAEYRDPWSLPTMLVPDNPYTISASMMRIKEKNIIKECDLIIAASPFISEYYKKFFQIKSFLATAGWTDDYTVNLKPNILSTSSAKEYFTFRINAARKTLS